MQSIAIAIWSSNYAELILYNVNWMRCYINMTDESRIRVILWIKYEYLHMIRLRTCNTCTQSALSEFFRGNVKWLTWNFRHVCWQWIQLLGLTTFSVPCSKPSPKQISAVLIASEGLRQMFGQKIDNDFTRGDKSDNILSNTEQSFREPINRSESVLKMKACLVILFSEGLKAFNSV